MQLFCCPIHQINRIVNKNNLHHEKDALAIVEKANCVLASLLMLLGFSCTDDEGEGPIICEYGTPYANFQIKGKVVDTNDHPIPNAQIRINRNDARIYPYGWLHTDTVRTDANGEFDWKKTDFPI